MTFDVLSFQSRYCVGKKCLNYIYDAASETWGCTITDIHLQYGYGAKGDLKAVLDMLCSGSQKDFCSMLRREYGERKTAKGQVKLE